MRNLWPKVLIVIMLFSFICHANLASDNPLLKPSELLNEKQRTLHIERMRYEQKRFKASNYFYNKKNAKLSFIQSPSNTTSAEINVIKKAIRLLKNANALPNKDSKIIVVSQGELDVVLFENRREVIADNKNVRFVTTGEYVSISIVFCRASGEQIGGIYLGRISDNKKHCHQGQLY